MPVAIETVIIIIVVVSFAVLSAVLFALYWLWRLLQEDRRCNRLNGSSYHPEWPIRQMEDGTQRALLGSRRVRNPRITRRQEVCVDERSRRRVKATRCSECQPSRNTTTSGMQTVPVLPTTSIPSVHSSVHVTNISHLSVPVTTSNPTIPVTASISHSPEVIVLDGTEPPPPYEAIVG